MNPSKFEKIKLMSGVGLYPINEYIYTETGNIKTMLYIDETTAYIDFVIDNTKNIRIENVSGVDTSYLYLIFKSVRCETWQAPESYNKRTICNNHKK